MTVGDFLNAHNEGLGFLVYVAMAVWLLARWTCK